MRLTHSNRRRQLLLAANDLDSSRQGLVGHTNTVAGFVGQGNLKVGGDQKIVELYQSTMTEKSSPPVAERLRIAREAVGLSQDELAKRVGMSGQTSIGEIERGRSRRPKKIAEIALEVRRSVEWLLGEGPLQEGGLPETRPTRPQPNAGPAMEATLPEGDLVPIVGQAEGGSDGKFALNGEHLAYAFRPPSLVGVKYAYAVFVHGQSMEDRFRSGDLVWADPNRPIKKGDDVVVQIKPDVRGEVPFGYVKRFVSRSPNELVLEQLNPQDGMERIIRFPGSSVISVHKVVFVEPG